MLASLCLSVGRLQLLLLLAGTTSRKRERISTSFVVSLRVNNLLQYCGNSKQLLQILDSLSSVESPLSSATFYFHFSCLGGFPRHLLLRRRLAKTQSA